tara:strand:- start:1681 stop:1923 length:243 start_codon:yes stop_codon:yes gene_type:complete
MNKTTRNLLIILFILMIFNSISRNKLNKTNGKSKVNCGDQLCGGYATGGMVGMSPPCPEGCKCGEVNPMLPDAPRKCEPI